ncbi:pre-mRNA cleavage complex 2 protein Pcf11-like [Ptychodera flava]|uniref:pre-mRNA cleavage complex 2 protein Pcf11-like n=1 Tax=Ptychodera flava TaxID=63121 RepID=UPI003969F179
MMSEEQAFSEDFKSSLSDLTFNSKPLINMLTMLAEENVAYAPHVVRLIEERLNQAKPAEKLPVLYLLDSILKNISGTYQNLFAKNIVNIFCGVFAKVDEKTRQAMFKLRTTWSEYFPAIKLHPLDVQVNSIDPAWPIMTPPPQQPTIHVNPKFIKKTDSGTSVLTASIPTSSTSSSSDDLQRQAEQEKQEALMRQQLIAKQHELLQLQQKKLEMELLQTKSKIEQQTRDLEVKRNELQIQTLKKQELENQKIKQELEQQMMQQQKRTQHLQAQQGQHLQPKVQNTPVQQQQVPVSKPQPAAASTRDPRINSRDPRIRDPRIAQQKIVPQAKVAAPAVQEMIKELANSPRLSPLADSPSVSPAKEVTANKLQTDTKKADAKKKKTNKDSPKESKEISVKPTRNYRRGDKEKLQNQTSRTDSKAKTINKSIDSKKDKKENKPDVTETKKEDRKTENTEDLKTGKDRRPQSGRVMRDQKTTTRKDGGKSTDKRDIDKRDKPKDKNDKRDKSKVKKIESKGESDRLLGSRRGSMEEKKRSRSKSPSRESDKSLSSRRGSAEEKKRSRSKSPRRSRSKSPSRTGSRSPRSRGVSPKSDGRRYMTRSRSPLRRNRRDIKDRVERKGRDSRLPDKFRKENEGREDIKAIPSDANRNRDTFGDDRFPRRRAGDYTGPDNLPPKKRARMGRGQENTWAPDDWRRSGWQGNRQWQRAPGRRPLERRLSLDPDVKIPKELSLSKQKDIIEQAEKQLNSGQLTHEQHQDLLMQLNDLYQLQRLRQEKRDTPVVYSRYDWPMRDYDARRDTDAPQTYFKGMDNAPVQESLAPGQNLTKDVDERVLDTMLMSSVNKTDSPSQNEEVFGANSSKDIDMRELPLSEAGPTHEVNRQSGNSVSSQSRGNYPPPLMSIAVRPPVGGKDDDGSGKMVFVDEPGRNSPLAEDNSMFGPTDQDMRRPDESLSFGPGMKDKDMRPSLTEGSRIARDYPVHDGPMPVREGPGKVEHHRPPMEDQRSMMKGHRGRKEGPGPIAEGQRPMIPVSGHIVDGPRPGRDGTRPMMKGPRVMIEGPRSSMMDGPRPMMEGPRPMMDGPRPMMEGPRPRMDGPRPMMERPRPMMDGPRHMMDGPRHMMDGPRQMLPGPRPMMEGPRPMIESGIRLPEGQMQGINMPMMPQNMFNQLAMVRSAMLAGQMSNQPQQQMMPNQSVAGPQLSMAGPMMSQPSAFNVMAAAQQMQGMTPSLPGAIAAIGMQAQGFPMGGPGMGMLNFGMPGPMVPQAIPQHVMQHPTVRTATPPPTQEEKPTAMDVNALFSKLLQAGIISKGGENSPRPEGVETPPPQASSQESQESKKTEKKEEEDNEDDQQDLIIPEIGFYPEELRVRFQGVINRIYNGIQCSSCGLRYLPEEMDKYAKHLDWHFRLNRREKDGAKKATSRKWYYKVDDWIKFEEIDDIEEGARSEFFELQARLGLTDLIKKPNQVTSIAVTGDDDTEEVCDICQESFEQFWDEEEEQWQLKDAIRVDGKTYHPLCYEDTKDVALETPTPVDCPPKPAFPVLGEDTNKTAESKPSDDNKSAESDQTKSVEISADKEQKKEDNANNVKVEQ